MICGIGVDTVDIHRFQRQLQRAPALRERLFTENERQLPVSSLAARFAAKEALMKALGGSGNLGWHDLSVIRGCNRAPEFQHTRKLLDMLSALHVERVHLSMTHDGSYASAFVVVEAR